jgi:iron complex outermembrane recepter protein
MRIFILLFILLLETSVYCQYSVQGKVSNEKNQPLENSHIHTTYGNVLSNPMGEFELNNLPKGKLRIFISYVGYKTCDTLISVEASHFLDVQLKPTETSLQEVVVKETSQKTKMANTTQITKKQVERSSSETLGDALKEVTGVTLLKTGSTIVKPMINGLHSSRVPIISNQVRLEDQQWGVEHAPNFDVNAAGKITVLKGAAGLQYSGDAVGGLVIIEPVSVSKDTLFGKTILSGVSNGRGGVISSSIHQGKETGWRWNALSTFKYLGDKEAPDYVLSNTGNREFNFSGDVSYVQKAYEISAFYSFYSANIGILSASHIGSANDLYQAIENQIPSVINDFTYTIQNPKQLIDHHLLKLNYKEKLDEQTTFDVYYAFQFNHRQEFDVRRGTNNTNAALDLTLSTHTLQANFEKNGTQWKWNSGLNGQYQNNFADPATGVRPLIPTYTKFDLGFYSIGNYEIEEGFNLEAGIRYDFSSLEATKYYQKSRWEERGYDDDFFDFIVGEEGNQWLTKPHFTFHNISGSLGVRKELKGDWTWFNNLSLAIRNPNPSEFFSDGLHHSSGQIELGDLRLEQEKSIKFSTSLIKNGNSYRLELNPYLHYISNFMFLKPVGFETTIRGAFPVWEYQQTNAFLTGLDLQNRWSISQQWEHLFSVAYVYGQDLTANLPLIDMPPLQLRTSIKYQKEEWNGLLLELQYESVFTQNRYPNYNFETNIVENDQLTPVTIDISTPPNGYQLLHFYSEVRLPLFKKATTALGFSVQNILNTSYRDYLNRQRFYADEMGRNIQLQLKINY